MVVGVLCFMTSGTGNLVKMEEITKGRRIWEDIKSKPQAVSNNTGSRSSWVSQHYSEPKHTSFLVKNYLQKTKHDWPARSPHLNHNEILWSELRTRISRQKIINSERPWEIHLGRIGWDCSGDGPIVWTTNIWFRCPKLNIHPSILFHISLSELRGGYSLSQLS